MQHKANQGFPQFSRFTLWTILWIMWISDVDKFVTKDYEVIYVNLIKPSP